MHIFFLANDFSRRKILQNFQYSLMPTEWRAKYDNFYEVNENIHEIIAKRAVAGIWDRDNATVWTIKSFYVDEYLKQTQSVIILFENSNSFMSTFKVLQTSSFRSLLQVNCYISFNKSKHIHRFCKIFLDNVQYILFDKKHFI